MALMHKAVFPQTPKMASTIVSSANNNTDGTGTIAHLITAGTDGMSLTGLEAQARGTVTACSVRVFVSYSGSSNWVYFMDGLIPAHTVANSTANAGRIALIDPDTPTARRELPAGTRIGVAIAVSVSAGVVVTAYGMDY